MNYKVIDTDVLVIGAGVSGLRAAVEAAECGQRVTLIGKSPCASPDIMGFNAPVAAGDTEELYFEDIARSGCGINDPRLARVLSKHVLQEVAWLELAGVHFGRDGQGNYIAIHTLGTTYPRLIRSGTSSGVTEMKVLQKLCDDMGISRRMPVDILGLLKIQGRVAGAYGVDMNAQELLFFSSKAVVLATGGCGAIQSFSTYPRGLVGDGYAMAYDAGASLVDMEFQQFEPCCFVFPKEIQGKVIATTLLRHGAELLNGEGREFMADYGLTRENAQKGSLARAMEHEVRAGRGTPHGGIYYNMTMLDPDLLYKDHDIFTKPAVAIGMDLTKDMPEMTPAAHTNLGGVVIDSRCETDVQGLFACGEVTGGLHGANRLGGCAGAETVVFGRIAGASAARYSQCCSPVGKDAFQSACKDTILYLESLLSSDGGDVLASLRHDLGEALRKNMGILRNSESLDHASKAVHRLKTSLKEARVESLKDIAEYIHCKNMLTVAEMQIKASAIRKESRGVFYREDYPTTDNLNWRKNILVRDLNGKMKLTIRDGIKDD